jgi:hypothetical protein
VMRVLDSEHHPADRDTQDAYRKTLRAMNSAGIPYIVGGGLAIYWYTGHWRATKDLDLFLLPRDVDRAMRALERAGFSTYRKHPEWLAEATLDQHKIDLIYAMGNWLEYMDEVYLERSVQGRFLGIPCRIISVEEMIHNKAFVAGRQRNDAPDIFKLLVAVGDQMDWQHLIKRFGEHWEVLLSHLIMFRYVFPSHRDVVPDEVMDELLARLQQTRYEPWTGGKLCRGPILDVNGAFDQYVGEWGYRDARREAWDELQRKRREETSAAA